MVIRYWHEWNSQELHIQPESIFWQASALHGNYHNEKNYYLLIIVIGAIVGDER
jgi:hypothetical protein